jgi:hypothetical protein
MVDRVREACEACFEAHKGDCGAFVRAVAANLVCHCRGLPTRLCKSSVPARVGLLSPMVSQLQKARMTVSSL